VLYYFKTPKDKAPAGFVPLENVTVRVAPEKLRFVLRPAEGNSLKSARMGTDGKSKGSLSRGHHKQFVFQADGTRELDSWVGAVRLHAVDDGGAATSAREASRSKRWSMADDVAGSSGEERGGCLAALVRCLRRKQVQVLAVKEELPTAPLPDEPASAAV
jgi:hypothetical protein